MGLTDIVKELGKKVGMAELKLGLPVVAIVSQLNDRGILTEVAHDWKYLAGVAAAPVVGYVVDKWKAYKSTSTVTSAHSIAPYRV